MSESQQQKETKVLSRASVKGRVIALVVFLLVVGLFAPLVLAANDKIDIERLLGLCGFKQRYGLPCPTCGITTAAIAFVSGRIFTAFYIQPAGALFCFILLVSAFLAFVTAVFGVYFAFLKRFFSEVRVKAIILTILAIIAAGWAVTLARALADG